MPLIVVSHVLKERMAFCGKCLLSLFVMCFERLAFYGKCLSTSWMRLSFCGKCIWLSFAMCFMNVLHFAGNTIYRPESMIEALLAFCGKCLLSSCVHDWGASGILREMPFIVLCPWLRSLCYFTGNAFYRPECMIEERLAFCGRRLLSSWVHDWGASGILREMPFIVLSPWLRSVWHFAGNAFYRPESRIEERLAFCGKCVSYLCAKFLKSFWHFKGKSFDRPEFMFEERLAFCGKCFLSPCVMCFNSVWHFSGNGFLSSCVMFFKSFWHFTGMHLMISSPCLRSVRHFAGNALQHRVSCVSRASGILQQMPFIDVRPYLRKVRHFAGNAFYRPV